MRRLWYRAGMPPSIPTARVPQTNICEIVRSPSAYVSHLLNVRAEVLLALPHGAMLLDHSCSGAGIKLGIDLQNADQSVVTLTSSILNDCTEPKQAAVPGVFTGRLVYSATGRLEIRLAKVTNLKVQSCEPRGPLPILSSPSVPKLP